MSTRSALRGSLALGMTWILLTLTACHRPTPPEEPTAAAVSQDDLETLWDASLRVLSRHGFQPDRQDRAAGIITTDPVTCMQWHEPWRQDVADNYSLAMSSLHTVRRQVTVRFSNADPWTVEVQVDVYLLSAPDYQVTTASAGIRSFSGDLPTISGDVVLGQDVRRWVSLGRDAAMEARLLDRITSYY